MNLSISMRQGEKYTAFAVESPQTVHAKLCTLSLPFLQDLWWEYYDGWQNNKLSMNQKIPVWVHLQVLTNLLIDRKGWDLSNKRPLKGKPMSVEEPFKTYTVGSKEWMEYWKNNPDKQRDMIEYMRKQNDSAWGYPYGWVD